MEVEPGLIARIFMLLPLSRRGRANDEHGHVAEHLFQRGASREVAHRRREALEHRTVSIGAAENLHELHADVTRVQV